jgi:hypothetical protein
MLRLAIVAFVLVGAVSAWGGAAQAKESNPTKKCSSAPAALSGPNGLPTDFPSLSSVVYTSTSSAGPSQIAIGYMTTSLGKAYVGWTKALKSAPYTVTHREKDPDDAEVNFSSPTTSGQVKLEDACPGRLSVRVTARPA